MAEKQMSRKGKNQAGKRSGTPVLEPGERVTKKLVAAPGPIPRTVELSSGDVVKVPEDWALLEPGDGTITRRVKKGPHWATRVRVRRRWMSRGVWAPRDRIESVTREVEAMRRSPEHKRKLAQSRKRREREHRAYVREFTSALRDFLSFSEEHLSLEKQLAQAVASHATPVGSGTVARTKRISVERRAEAAVIAWMRHQTTAYDDMRIPRQKGKRREVRRKLAARSRKLLDCYREGNAPDPSECPLVQALEEAGISGDESGIENAADRSSSGREGRAKPAIRGILSRRMKERQD